MAYSKFVPSNAVVPGDTQTGTDSGSTHEFTGSVFISGTLSASNIVGGMGTDPGGADTNIQYNDGGMFGGDANLTWDKTGQEMVVLGDISASVNISASAFYGDGSNLTNLPAGSPAGADTQLQYNNAGAFGADANLTWDDTGQVLNVTGDITASANISASSEISATSFVGDGSGLTNLPAGSPAGADTQVQYNNAGAFGADANFVWNSTNQALTVTGDISASALVSSSFFYGDGSNLTNLPAGDVNTGNTLWVDSVNGNDGTAVSGRLTKPYLTVDAALNAATSGDTVIIRPGTYTESGLTLSGGVALISEGGYSQITIGDNAATSDIIAAQDGAWIEGITIAVPAGAGLAGVRYTGGIAGTFSAYNMSYSGDGATGAGDGFVKTGTGKVIGAEVRVGTGGLNSVLRVNQGVMAFESIHVPQSAGTINAVAYVENGSRAQLINFNAGNSNVTDALFVTGSGSTAICLNVNWFNIENGLNVDEDGCDVEINSGKIEATGFSVKLNQAETFTTASQIGLSGLSMEPKFSFPPSALNSNFEADFTNKVGPNYVAADVQLGVDLVAGFPEKGTSLSTGEGEAYGTGIKVLSSDGTDTGTTVGAVTDITEDATSRTGSFTFQGGDPNYCLYFGTPRKDGTGTLLKHYGMQIETTVGSTTGEYVFEIWDGADWIDVDYMAASVRETYRYANNIFWRDDSDEYIRFGINGDTTWTTSTIDTTEAYWSRCRITTSASLPTLRKSWITPSFSNFSKLGLRQSLGLSMWEKTLVGAGNIFGESGGVVTANLTVGTGGLPTEWTQNMPNALLNQIGDAIYTQFAIPVGTCTAFPLSFKVLYSFVGSQPITATATGILSAIPLEVSGISVADPAGGRVPSARTAANTATLTAAAAPLALTSNLIPEGVTLPATLDNQVHSITFTPLSIEGYYEEDVIAIRFELDDDGTPNQDVAIWAIIVEGVGFTDGKALLA